MTGPRRLIIWRECGERKNFVPSPREERTGRDRLEWASVKGQPGHPKIMLRQSLHEVTISTRGRGFHDFTDQVAALVGASKLQTGLVTLHLRHTSASLLIQENADPEVQRDFERFFARLV